MSIPIAIVTLTVARVEERHSRVYLRGVGSTAEFRDESLGWFAVFREPYIALKVGDTQPQLEAGDRVILTLERADVAAPPEPLS